MNKLHLKKSNLLKLSLITVISLSLFACEQSEKINKPQIKEEVEESIDEPEFISPQSEIEEILSTMNRSEDDAESDVKKDVEKEAESDVKSGIENFVNKNKLPASDYVETNWIDLIPQEDLDALLNPPSYLDDIVDGSDEDTFDQKPQNESDSIDDYRYQQALISRKIQNKFNNTPIKIPAFIVPLEFDDDQNVTQFFMVPFFGACLHLPPPPPNQTIFVDYPQGLKLESTYDAYWISGIITTSIVENDMATAAYAIEMHDIEIYTEE